MLPVRFSISEIRKHFDDSLNAFKAQFAVADYLCADGNDDGAKMIFRSIVVLVEGLLDFFIHEMSKYCLFKMFNGEWKKSEKYGSIMVPMNVVEEAIERLESGEWFFAYVNERFSRAVFLSLDSMREQLNLIGIDFTAVMCVAFPQHSENESVRYGSDVIRHLFMRRNEIAHQNDRSHASALQNDISREFVADYVSKVEAIVTAIERIAERKDAC